jgi:hypothetical protein
VGVSVKKKNVLEDGSLKRIWDWFLAPLVQYKPAATDVEQWMESLLDVKNRDIARYQARRGFKMPGLFCAAPLVRLQGLGKRKIRAGETLWVRQDALNPGWVEVETVDRHAQVFVLSTTEWNSIAALLEEQDGR